MPGEIAECRKNGEGKGVRAEWEEEVQRSCLGQHREQRECQEQEHSQTELPAPPVSPVLENQQGEIQQVEREISLLSVAEAEQGR